MINQKQAILYYLIQEHKKDKDRFVPVYEPIGEVFVKELGIYKFISYEVSARLSEMYSENPGLLERKRVTGRSGARYYAYRIKSLRMIQDKKLKDFYKLIKK